MVYMGVGTEDPQRCESRSFQSGGKRLPLKGVAAVQQHALVPRQAHQRDELGPHQAPGVTLDLF